jgi:hypothetical protein
MDIKYKIKLIEILRLRPADLNVLDSVILSDSCLEAIMKDDRAALDKELGAILPEHAGLCKGGSPLIGASIVD